MQDTEPRPQSSPSHIKLKCRQQYTALSIVGKDYEEKAQNDQHDLEQVLHVSKKKSVF